MRITKKAVKACEDLACQEPVVTPEADAVSVVDVAPVEAIAAEINPYGEAISNIRLAIDALGNLAKSDPVARESIANLSVVLFDLVG